MSILIFLFIFLFVFLFIVLFWKYINLREINKFDKFVLLAFKNQLILDLTNTAKYNFESLFPCNVYNSKGIELSRNDILAEYEEKNIEFFEKICILFEQFYNSNISFKELTVNTRYEKTVHYVINNYYHVLVCYSYDREGACDTMVGVTLYKLK